MKKILTFIMMSIMVITFSLPFISFADTMPDKTKSDIQKKDTVSIVFTHDMHSHLEKFSRLSTVIKNEKKKNKATFVFDAGDFSMGTPFQAIYKKEASELRMMGAVGYDATTLGNHEFDFRSKGLSAMLESAVKSKDRLPQLVISNIDWETTLSDTSKKSDGEKLKQALKDYGAKDYAVIEKDGVKVAVFGIFGMESASYAPESGTDFADPVATAQKTVDKIKSENSDIDLIVCLSHSGTNEENKADSEDETLAESVDGIDLIVSGHSHTYLSDPIVKNGTVIASCGQYNENAGYVEFKKKDGKFTLNDYSLIPLDSSVKKDSRTEAETASFKQKVTSEYFKRFGMSWDEVIGRTDFDFTDISEFGHKQGEDILGNLITDSYLYAIKEAEGSKYEKIYASFLPAGVVRGSFSKGKITAADAFNVLSIGTGRDGLSGYPIGCIYLTGKELKMIPEIDISISPLMQPARLYMSGMSYKYNPNRLILDKAYDIKLTDENGKTEEIDDKKLYRIAVDLYSAQMLSEVNSKSYGLLSIVPKNKDGEPVKDFEDYIVHIDNGTELKMWYALASYIESFPDGKIPQYYSQTHDRKVCVDSHKLTDILKSPNRFFWMITAAGILAVAVILLIIVLILKLVNRIRYGKGGKPVKKKDMIFERHNNRYRF